MPRQCKLNWLDAYLSYTSDQESPKSFHTWVGLSLLSATVNRNVEIPRIKYTIYPNLFVILVAGSAKCKKSTAINIGMRNILSKIENCPLIFAQKITAEALIQSLCEAKKDKVSSGLICADELSVFLGPDAQASGVIPLLTQLYDSPDNWIYRTRSRGAEEVGDTTIVILAGTTHQWLKSSISPDSVGGGFTSRIIFVYEERPHKPILFGDDVEEDHGLMHRLIDDLSYIRAHVKGRIKFSPKAKAVALAWYKAEWHRQRDEKLDGYYARKHDTMFKVAALLSIGERDDLLITEAHINRALDLLAGAERNLTHIMSTVLASPVGGKTEKILEHIKREGKIKHSDLLRKSWRIASAIEMSEMIKTLIESREITEELGGDKRTRFYIYGADRTAD